jgi:hypothetical protein
MNEGDLRAQVIKVSEDVMKMLLKSEEVMINDYIMTDFIAHKRVVNKEWVWRRLT